MIVNSQVCFKIDTGEDATVIADRIYEALLPTPTLVKPTKTLSGPPSYFFPPIAWMFCGKNPQRRQNNRAVDICSGCCLQRPSSSSSYQNSCYNNKRLILWNPQTYVSRTFHRIGKRWGPINVIKLKPDTKPYVLSTSRRVPEPLPTKVKEKLSRMEQMQIISKVDEPTEQSVGMVDVSKANGKVRTCVDLTNLEESIRCRMRTTP